MVGIAVFQRRERCEVAPRGSAKVDRTPPLRDGVHFNVLGCFAAINQLFDGGTRTVCPGNNLQPPRRGKGRHRDVWGIRFHAGVDTQYRFSAICGLRHHAPVRLRHLQPRVHLRRPVNLPARGDTGGAVMKNMGTVEPGLIPELALHHDKRFLEGAVIFANRYIQSRGHAQSILRCYQRLREKVLNRGRRCVEEHELKPDVSIDRRQRWIKWVVRWDIPAFVVFESHNWIS